MASSAVLVSIVVVALSLAAAATSGPPPDAVQTASVRAGYYLAADARLRPLASLDASLYTHLYYSALPVDNSTRAPAVPADPDQARLLATFSRELKSRNRALRTLLSVGGGGGVASVASPQTRDPAFAAVTANPSSRASFVAAAVSVARANGFDGVDVAWWFPASAAEMARFGLLVTELRAAAPPGFLLTATVYFSAHVFLDAGADYPSEVLVRALDWANVAAFGLAPPPASAATTNATTAFDAPLYDRATHFSASYGVVSWLDAGVPAAKLVVGLPLYARSWVLRNKARDGVGAPVVAAGPRQRGDGTDAAGVMSYAEVQRLAASGGAVGDQAAAVTTKYDNASVASYLSVGDVWVAFDGAAVVDEKLAFAARHGLLGYFLWPVNYDDANLTIARRASEAWMMQNQISSDSRNGTGVRQTQATPVRVPPALQSPARTPGPMPAPTTSASSSSWLPLPPRKLGLFLHCGLQIFLAWV